MMKKIGLVVFVLSFLLAGCAGFLDEGGLPAEDTPVPTETEAPATPVSSDVPEPELTEEPVEEPTLPVLPVSESAVCALPSEHPEMAYTDYETFPQAIMDYLNSGASTEELAVTLIVQGLGPEEQPVWAEDLTGDDVREVVVTVFDETQPRQGSLLIFNCVDGQYVLSHLVISEVQAYAPLLLYIQDFNADGQREVVYSSTHCGAHTCFQDVQILQYENGEYITMLEGSTLEYPYPEIKLTDFDLDGMYNLEVIGTAIASVGAGPQRDSVNIWQYDSGSSTWKLVEQTLAASPFRVHLVHDAEAAMNRGEYLIASLLFQQVIEDEQLLDWADEEEEYRNLAAYAYYKRIVAAVYLNDLAAAEQLFDQLETLFGRGNQYAYVDMAEVFLLVHESDGLEVACTAVQQYSETNKAVILTPLGSSVYGYANPDFEPADVCP